LEQIYKDLDTIDIGNKF